MSLLNLIVPEELKKEFRKVYGKTFYSIDEIKISSDSKLITVGDISSYNAIKAGLKVSIIVYDGKEMRRPVRKEIFYILEKFKAEKNVVKNPAGQITEELWEKVKECLSKNCRTKIFVQGEEDLAAFPLILESPKDTIIIYGLIDKGVLLKVDEKIKNKCKELLKQMKGS